MREDLALEWEISAATNHAKIFRLSESGPPAHWIGETVSLLEHLAHGGDLMRIRQALFDLIAADGKVRVPGEEESVREDRVLDVSMLPAISDTFGELGPY